MQIVKLGTRGNSPCVTIPKHYVRELGWPPGTQLVPIVTPDGDLLLRSLHNAIKITQRDRRTSSGKPSAAAQRLKRRYGADRKATPSKDPRA
jgi:antitoxin component of MazEF toxin-antitoxin module